MAEGTVPEDWREANVKSIFKKGKKNYLSNYRPVSLISVCSKLMESVVRHTLTVHTPDSKKSERAEAAWV
jgi:hypothetical protein